MPTREDSVRFAIASTVMEGQMVSDDMEALLSEWAAGNLTDDELMRLALLKNVEPETSPVIIVNMSSDPV